MHRFFIFPPDQVIEDKVLILSSELIHQFVDVLRFQEGEEVIFLDNSGFEFITVIQKISKKQIEGRVMERKKNEAEPEIKITLFMALTKNQEKFEWVLQKGTEVGVSEFVPLITERTERQSLSKIERLQRILKEAAEQSGRGKIPELLETKSFKKLFTEEKIKTDMNLLAHPEEKLSLHKALTEFKKGQKINLFIGPEGGFSSSEIEKASENKFLLFSLGKRVLRAETAAIVIPILTLFDLEL